VTYALPKRMGSALGWTDADRVPLFEAYLEVTSDTVKGTARTKDNLWATVHKVWGKKERKKGPMRVERVPSALEKQFKRIWAGVSAFTSHYLAVKAMLTTGNPSEEDIISGAVACYCSLDVYDAIRADRNQDKVNDKTRKRKAKVAHCKWVACWRVLRQSDKFSGAANGGDASGMDIMGDTSSEEEESGSGSGSGPSRRTGGFQSRPVGIKRQRCNAKRTYRWTPRSRRALRLSTSSPTGHSLPPPSLALQVITTQSCPSSPRTSAALLIIIPSSL